MASSSMKATISPLAWATRCCGPTEILRDRLDDGREIGVAAHRPSRGSAEGPSTTMHLEIRRDASDAGSAAFDRANPRGSTVTMTMDAERELMPSSQVGRVVEDDAAALRFEPELDGRSGQRRAMASWRSAAAANIRKPPPPAPSSLPPSAPARRGRRRRPGRCQAVADAGRESLLQPPGLVRASRPTASTSPAQSTLTPRRQAAQLARRAGAASPRCGDAADCSLSSAEAERVMPV